MSIDSSCCKVSSLTIYSYVQMLERQHAQLIAGLQALYRCTQNGDRWTGPRLELVNHNQPLTHKILEALGVLRTDEWEDMESVDGTWQGFERHIQDDNQAAFSPTSPTQTAFPQSEIMSKRRSKDPNSLASTTQTLSMPPLLMATLISVKPDPYNMTMPLDTFPSNELTNEDLDRTPESMMDWSFGMDDLFGNLGGQEQTVKIC